MRRIYRSTATTWVVAGLLASLVWITIPSPTDIQNKLAQLPGIDQPVYRVDSVSIADNPEKPGVWLVTEIREVLLPGDQWATWNVAIVRKPSGPGEAGRTVCVGTGRQPYNIDKGEWLPLPFDEYVGVPGCQDRLGPGTYAMILNRTFERPDGSEWHMPRYVLTFTVPLSAA